MLAKPTREKYLIDLEDRILPKWRAPLIKDKVERTRLSECPTIGTEPAKAPIFATCDQMRQLGPGSAYRFAHQSGTNLRFTLEREGGEYVVRSLADRPLAQYGYRALAREIQQRW